MPNGTIGGVSKAIEKGVPGVVGVPVLTKGGLVVVSRYLHLLVGFHPLAGCWALPAGVHSVGWSSSWGKSIVGQ